MADRIQLSDHFTFKRLLRFVFPSIVMMIFTSIYGVVDGLFVSNFAGKTAFAAVNLIMPLPMLIGTLGFMFGTGGSAIVSKAMGEGKQEAANKYFSMMVYVTLAGGIICAIIGELIINKVAIIMGADEEMMPLCLLYGRILMATMPFFMLQNIFQSFLVTAEKPKIGLRVTVAAGLANMLLDLLLVGIIRGGVVGAAIATGISQLIGGVIPLIYFVRKNNSRLRLIKTSIDFTIVKKAAINGSSEFMTNVSFSLVNILYNAQLMKFAGQNGVAAYGVIMYVCFIFVAVFIGYSIGSAPLVGFNYGAGNTDELKNLFHKSLAFMGCAGVSMLALAFMLSYPLSSIFVGYDAELLALTTRAFRIYSTAFLVQGFNIYGSAFFTALGNGLVSALISFMRTLLFQIVAVLLLPAIFGIDGIWFSILTAECCALVVTITFLVTKRKVYRY